MAAPLILLAGASSQVGIFALPRLVSSGCEVVAVNRTGQAPAFMPSWRGVDWCDATAARARVGARRFRLLSVGPIELATRLLDREYGVDRAVALSTTSTATKAGSADAAERALMERITAAEGRLTGQSKAGGFPLILLRPTLVWGAGMDDNLGRAARWIRRFGALPVAAPARGLRQPLHAEDLARTACRAVLGDGGQPLDSPVVGADTVAYRDMMAAVFRALGRKPRLIGLPEGLAATAAGLAGATGWLTGVNAEMVRRQNRDLVFDDQLARARLGHAPRPFAPRPIDFRPPDRDRLEAMAAPVDEADQASLR